MIKRVVILMLSIKEGTRQTGIMVRILTIIMKMDLILEQHMFDGRGKYLYTEE